jgi:hypothetical protein
LLVGGAARTVTKVPETALYTKKHGSLELASFYSILQIDRLKHVEQGRTFERFDSCALKMHLHRRPLIF